MDEARLIEKLRRIEALFAGATTDGERVAADEARKRISARLAEVAKADPPIEYRFGVDDPWARKILIALLRRYGVAPYRHHGQKRASVMAKVSQSFVERTLWPEFQEISNALRQHLEEITDRVIAETIHKDSSDAAEVPAPKQLTR